MKRFHAHIYFDLNEMSLAQELNTKITDELSYLTRFQQFYVQPIGPHPKAMIEFHFGEPDLAMMKIWLEKNRRSFSVLIHEDTQNDVRDHLENILWLGERLEINFDFFELILRRPELRVHPE